jgi:hypothetical protein
LTLILALLIVGADLPVTVPKPGDAWRAQVEFRHHDQAEELDETTVERWDLQVVRAAEAGRSDLLVRRLLIETRIDGERIPGPADEPLEARTPFLVGGVTLPPATQDAPESRLMRSIPLVVPARRVAQPEEALRIERPAQDERGMPRSQLHLVPLRIVEDEGGRSLEWRLHLVEDKGMSGLGTVRSAVDSGIVLRIDAEFLRAPIVGGTETAGLTLQYRVKPAGRAVDPVP